MRLAKGDKFWVQRSGLFGLVIRVSRREGWADILWRNWGARRSERLRLTDPILAPAFRREWTEADIAATRPKFEVVA